MLKATDPLAALGHLPALTQGTEAYARALLGSDREDVLQVGGALLLLQQGAARESDLERLLSLARFAAVRDGACQYFESILERDTARRFAEAEATSGAPAIARILRARTANDLDALVSAHELRYLESGEPRDLRNAAAAAENARGWRAALPIYAKALAVAPYDLESSTVLARALESSGQFDLLADFIDRLRPLERQRPVLSVYSASVLLAQGRAAEALELVDKTEAAGRSGAIRYSIGPIGQQLRGRALDKMGRYVEAHRAFEAKNELSLRTAPSPAFGKMVLATNSLAVPSLGPGGRPDVVMMLGFPRSGTTLLENALAAHPAVESFEEIGTLRAATAYIERGNAGRLNVEAGSTSLFQGARERYYAELEWNSRKVGASLFVDKAPIRSCYAPFIRRLIPDQRFVFSVRHPYDVIISCFRQNFRSNVAMSAFLRLSTAVQLYDQAMTAWFSVHTLDSADVNYVRYEDLVEQFRPTLASTLAFLGLDWDDAVGGFAERAAEKANRTPSYGKVRQGLSLGVQTYWRNYDFLFRQREMAPLTKWAKFFGYETV